MGGSALKNTTTRRYDAIEYHQLKNEVLENLRKYLHTNGLFYSLQAIPAYNNKPSFGDLDILVVSDNLQDLRIHIKKFLQLYDPDPEVVSKHWESYEVVKNSNVYSFAYKEFQIDLICHHSSIGEIAYHYYSYNDLGNLIGRIAHKMGLKFGHDGLTYVFKDGDYVVGEIVLSRNYWDILEFLGFKNNFYEFGFETIEDIFDFITDNPFFSKEIFQFENRNHAGRSRDSKRKTYLEFLEYIKDRKFKYEYQWNKDKKVYLPFFLTFFKKKQEYNDLILKNNIRKLYRDKFNGNIITELTGLEGKELGEFIVWLKSSGKYEISYVIEVSAKQIAADIINDYKEYIVLDTTTGTD